jgi:serine/threonine protein kinase
MSLQLHVIQGPDTGRVFTLHPGDDNLLGRGKEVLYQVTDQRTSRTHCQIVRDGDQVSVICLGGSGGTFVNDKPVKKQKLKPGDVLRVGETHLRLQIGDLPMHDVRDAPGGPVAAAAAAADKLQNLSGQKLAHYDVGPVIGQGSTCMVFHATDTKDDRPVALKVLLPEFSKDENEMQRFVRAVKTVLPLRHPNLVSMYAAGRTGPHCWVAMEYIAGEDMVRVIERIGVAGMLDWRYAFKVAVQVGRALAYAHEQHIVHRNVTPKNIILDAPTKTAKLGDLMKGKALEGVLAQQITKPGELIGDVTYMSPERTRGTTDIDVRSDLYGLGATTYALLTGRPPLTGSTLVEKIGKIRTEVPVKPTKYQMSIPSGFEGIVMKLLAKKPEERGQSAAELVKELERVGRFNGVTE